MSHGEWHEKFWDEVRAKIRGKGLPLDPGNTRTGDWLLFSVGGQAHPQIKMMIIIGVKEQRLQVRLGVFEHASEGERKRSQLWRSYVTARQSDIEKELCFSCEWGEGKEIVLQNTYPKRFIIEDTDQWADYIEWGLGRMQRLQTVFTPIIAAFDSTHPVTP